MDEAALRAMLPMGFGKASRAGSRARAPPAAPPNKGTKRPASDGGGEGGEKPAADKKVGHPRDDDGDDGDGDDDGLTAEERAANEALLASRHDDDSDDDSDDDDDDSDVDLGPEPPSGPGTPASASASASASAASRRIPLDHEALLFSPPVSLDGVSAPSSSSARPITALSIDSSGARVATGGMDYRIQLWDFGGMVRGLRPLASIDVFGSYFVNDVAFSGNGERLLAVSGTAQPKLLDRNGVELATYKKGDPYLRDMKQTKGHVAEVTSCSWFPAGNGRQDTFATTSADSTVRLWDPEVTLHQKTVVPVRSKVRGGRTKVCTHAFSPDGARTLAAGCADGALHLWSTAGSYARPSATREAAHAPQHDVTALAWSRDARTLASRSTDGTLKLWDVRAFKAPLAHVAHLHTSYANTSVAWSPDGEHVLTASDAGLHVFAARGLSPVQVLRPQDPDPDASAAPAPAPAPTPAIRASWHPRLNQLLCTTSRGSTSIFYSPSHSSRGVLLLDEGVRAASSSASARARARARAQAQAQAFDPATFNGPIITPGAAPGASASGSGAGTGTGTGTGTSEASKRRRLARLRADPAASQIPQRPLVGAGKGGRIGGMGVAAQGGYDARSEDPREALLKYAEVSKASPRFTAAWGRTQPETIYARGEEGEEGEEGEGEGR